MSAREDAIRGEKGDPSPQAVVRHRIAAIPPILPVENGWTTRFVMSHTPALSVVWVLVFRLVEVDYGAELLPRAGHLINQGDS